MNFTKTIGFAVLMMAAATLPALASDADAYPEQRNENYPTVYDEESSSMISQVDYQLLDSYHWTDPHCHIDTGVGCNVKTT